MAHTNNKPIPQIDLEKCDGCGLCVRACQNKALAIRDGKGVVLEPRACDYGGVCEAVCPLHAISRPFEIIVITSDDGKIDKSR